MELEEDATVLTLLKTLILDFHLVGSAYNSDFISSENQPQEIIKMLLQLCAALKSHPWGVK